MSVFYLAGANQTAAALDAEGDLWVANQNTSALNPAPSLYEFSNKGDLLSGVAGYTGAGIDQEGPNALAIDPSGNVFTTDFGGAISKFTPTAPRSPPLQASPSTSPVSPSTATAISGEASPAACS